MGGSETYWIQASFKGSEVFAECDEQGDFKVRSGRISMRYNAKAQKTYNASASNVDKVPGTTPFLWASEGSATPPKTEAKTTNTIRPGAIVAYTDGACSGNPGPAGSGVMIENGAERTELSIFLGDATNNIAELEAISAALAEIPQRDAKIELFTDSSYAIGVLTKGWKAKANQELIARIRGQVRAFDNLRFHWVKGHAGHPGNERADELARQAIERTSTVRDIQNTSPQLSQE